MQKIWLVIDGFTHPISHEIDGEILAVAKSEDEVNYYKEYYKDTIKYLDFYEIEINKSN